MEENNNHRLDRALREKAGAYRKFPSERIWKGIEPRLNPTPAEKFRKLRPFLLLLAGLLLFVAGNLLPDFWPSGANSETGISANQLPEQPQSFNTDIANSKNSEAAFEPQQEAMQGNQATTANNLSSQARAKQSNFANHLRNNNIKRNQPNLRSASQTNPPVASVANSNPLNAETAAVSKVQPQPEDAKNLPVSNQPTLVAATFEFPVILTPLVESERQLQGQLSAVNNSPGLSVSEQLLVQNKELGKLKQRNDSLLAALAEKSYVAASQVADSAAAIQKRRWSVAMAFAPELNFMHLSASNPDSTLELRRNHERGRAGANAAFMLEYQLTDKLRIGAGLGYSTYGSELRLTSRETLVNVIYDTTTTTHINSYSNTYTNYIVREDSIAVLDPIFNQSGQLIGYNTVYVPKPDTVWTTVIIEASDTSHLQTITPLIHKTEKTTYKKLKPEYHFVTLPVMLNYTLTSGKRWWAEAGVGGQLQFFRGGRQLVSEDNGRTYRTEKVSANAGPFRPVNIALMGNISVNYGLTQRLSVSLAPAVRWQVQSVYKKETGLKQNPLATGLQIGLRYRL